MTTYRRFTKNQEAAMNTLEKICADKLEHVHRTEHLIPEIVFLNVPNLKLFSSALSSHPKCKCIW